MSENEIIETIPSVNTPVNLGVTKQAIKELQKKYKEVPDAKTPEGYKAIKDAKGELTPLRTGVEKERKLQVSAALAHQKRVNAEAKEITQLIVDIETPLYAAKKAVDDEEERIKREAEEAEASRISEIEGSIEYVKNSVNGLIGASSRDIKERLESLDVEINPEYLCEFTDLAIEVKATAIETLQAAYDERRAYETQQAEQAEREKKMAEQQAEIDRKQAEIDAEIARQEQEKRDKQIKKAAAEKATREAEEKANAKINAAEEIEKQAVIDAEEAKRNAEEAVEQAKKEAAETEDRVKREAEELKQKEKAETEAREADIKHKRKINANAVLALVEGGMSDTAAKKAVTLIAQRKIPEVTITY